MKTSLPLFILGMSALSACATVPTPTGAPVAGAVDRHVIRVTEGAERLEIPVSTGAATLPANAEAQLSSFASGYLQYGHGALILSTPSGSANADAASVLANETRRALVDAGVSYAAVAGSTYDASGVANAPLVLSFVRFEAHAPECAPIWEQDLGHQNNNQAWASFGCATQANLAAMVEDPRDLATPRDMAARDSGSRDKVMDAYRAGQQTHATRSADERATVSNAVQ